MDMKRIANMADKIAKENEKDPLNEIDSAIDIMIGAIETIEENIDLVDAQNPVEKSALAKIKDIFETAINPYLADAIEEMEKFEE